MCNVRHEFFGLVLSFFWVVVKVDVAHDEVTVIISNRDYLNMLCVLEAHMGSFCPYSRTVIYGVCDGADT